MRTSIFDLPQSCEDILALRRVIAEFAGRCGIDLADGNALRSLLDGDFSECRAAGPQRQNCQELSAMLTLLLRLEASSSEDLGITGLRRYDAFSLTDGATDAQNLLAVNVGVAVRGDQRVAQ